MTTPATLPDEMAAVVFHGHGELRSERRPVPKLEREDDIVLRVLAVGICGSDLHILEVPPTHAARPGIIFGHEFAGEVVSVGSAVRDLAPGDHVAIDQNAPCGSCSPCRTGAPNFCHVVFDNPHTDETGWPNTPGQWWDGGMAEYVRVPARFAYKVPDEVPMHHVVLAEPLGCVMNGVAKVTPRPGERAVVIGGGPIGLLFLAVLKRYGLDDVVVVEPSDYRAEIARSIGAGAVIDPMTQDATAAIRALFPDGVDIVIEAVGSQLPLAIDIAARQGRIVELGVNSAARTEISPFGITSKELRIVGAFLMMYSMAESVKLIVEGQLPLDEIVTHVLPLGSVHEGVDLARTGQGLKVVFVP